MQNEIRCKDKGDVAELQKILWGEAYVLNMPERPNVEALTEYYERAMMKGLAPEEGKTFYYEFVTWPTASYDAYDESDDTEEKAKTEKLKGVGHLHGWLKKHSRLK